MFLKSYVEIPTQFDVVRAAVEREPLSWLEGLAVEAEREGESLLVDVGLSLAGRSLRRPADLQVGEPQVGSAVASLPIRLRVHGSQRLLPSFYGSLDAAWLGAQRTQLALSLQYEPPLGLLGKAMDRTLLHRVAESVAQNFLAGAARRLEERTYGGAAKESASRNLAVE
jgi:hypothetical protein